MPPEPTIEGAKPMIVDYMAKRFKTVIMGYIAGILILCAVDARSERQMDEWARTPEPPYECHEVYPGC